MDYWTGYLIFALLFLAGSIGYWVVARALGDPDRIYEGPRPQAATEAKRGG